MPVLKEETSLFPEDLFDRPPSDCDERVWYAIYTKARQEKALARQLLAYEIPFYLPLVPKDNLIRNKRVRALIPLFAGYVFVFADPSQRVRSLTTNRISQILEVTDQQRMQTDLRQIHQLIESDAPLTVESKLIPGQKVRIKGGPMHGLEGAVVSRRGRSKLIVSVDFLQQGVSVEIDDFQVELLS